MPATLGEAELAKLVESAPLVRRALEGTLAVPNFPWLCNELSNIHAALKQPEHSVRFQFHSRTRTACTG